jgi:DNA helicase-2/ATP-dependent DNA helicase PcrA
MNELQQILQHINNGKNFLLSGGAGSGKTYSLVEVIKEIIEQYSAEKVFCMTYTNVAVKEIEERVDHPNLEVSTIHGFLWENIKHFQKEIKESIITLANDDSSKLTINNEELPIHSDYFLDIDEIEYKEYVKIENGVISHDEVIWISELMFKNHKKLCDILKDKYKFIFVDEYQDTHKEVVSILLEHIVQSNKHTTIGFFGDAMQSIYPDGVGDVKSYLNSGVIQEVQKQQNRRSPQLIINLANKLRTDGLVQEPSNDNSAPNMLDGKVKEGAIKFLYSNNPNLENVRTYLTENFTWDFNDNKNLKELNLTHKLIANKAGFQSLMYIYTGDQILNFAYRIKKYIKDHEITDDFSGKSFEEVVNILQAGKFGKELKSVSPTTGMQKFIDDNQELYKYAKQYDYIKLSKIYIEQDQLLDSKKQTEEEEEKRGSKRDNLIKHLFKLESIISLYKAKRYNEFLRIIDFPINTANDKKILNQHMKDLIDVEDKTIEEVVDKADSICLCLKDDRFNRFVNEKQYVYDRVKEVEYQEFQYLFNYLEGKTPFTTQHKTKGDEFDNVLVVLDNGGWRHYNFENLFLNVGSETVLERTKKLFYVCCTRTKENLAIF